MSLAFVPRISLFYLLLSSNLLAQQFIPHSDAIQGISGGVAWGDYDKDGDSDLVVLGNTFSEGRASIIYMNERGSFHDIKAGLIGVNGAAAWGDYDNDGDLDLALAGYSSSGAISKIYRNDSGIFVDIVAPLWGNEYTTVSWGDIEGDRDLDLLISGRYSTRIYKNSSNAFSEFQTNLPTYTSSAVWGDYDNDGDLDVFCIANTQTDVYRNQGSQFEKLDAITLNLGSGIASWADFNQDGFLDLAITGSLNGSFPNPQDGFTTRIYRGDGMSFSLEYDVGHIAGFYDGAVSWGDYDSDGDLDLFVCGQNGTKYFSKMFRNEGLSVPRFREINAGIADVAGGGEFADYDGDGDQDLAVTGSEVRKGSVGYIYENVRGSFSTVRLPPMHDDYCSSVDWGDYDSDGDLDVLAGGYASTQIYRNDNGVIVDPGLYFPRALKAQWLDINNDGKLDFYLQDYLESRVFMNVGGTFLDSSALLPLRTILTSQWVDLDQDGLVDLLAVDASIPPPRQLRMYHNNGSRLVLTEDSLPEPNQIVTGDYNSDGYTDLLLSGVGGDWQKSWVFSNSKGKLTESQVLMAQGKPEYFDFATWGDYDNDGDLDLFLCGPSDVRYSPPTGYVSRIYQNIGGRFYDSENTIDLTNSALSASWGDFDADGDLDCAFGSGDIIRNDQNIFHPLVIPPGTEWGDFDNDGDLDMIRTSGPTLFVNNIQRKNTSPSPPHMLSSVIGQKSVSLSWSTIGDSETPSAGLSFSLRVGKVPGGGELVAPMSTQTGTPLRPLIGNAGYSGKGIVSGLGLGKYYWSVQSVDNNYARSTFSLLDSFTIGIPAPVGFSGSSGNGSVSLLWKAVSSDIFHSYRIYGAISNDSMRLIDSSKDMSNTNRLVKGLLNDTTYKFRISVLDIGGNESLDSDSLLIRTDGSPPSPPANLSAQPGNGQVILNWSASRTPDYFRYVIDQIVHPPNGPPKVISVDSTSGVNDTVRTITGLQNNVTYRFCVRALDTILNSSDSSNIITVTLTSLGVSADSVDFSDVMLGQAKSFPVVLQNLSPAAIQVNSLAFPDGQFSAPAFAGLILEAHQQATVNLRFKPGQTGAFTSLLAIHSDAAVNPVQHLFLRGRCVAPALDLSPSAFAFGAARAGTVHADTLTLKNIGDGALVVDSLVSNHAWFLIDNRSATLAPGAGLKVGVRFAPGDESASLNATISVHSNVRGSPHALPVSGTGLRSRIALPVTSIDFKTLPVHGFVDTVVLISNLGNGELTVDSTAFTHPAFSLRQPFSSIPAHGSAPLVVRFAPREDKGGDYSASLKLYLEGAPAEIPLSGRATAKPLCRITQIVPAAVAWDTSTTITFLSGAHDSDQAGGGDAIRSWLWSSSLDGRLGNHSAAVTLRASGLTIGKHEISLRVVDNEGDTSDPAKAPLVITNRRPLTRIDGVTPSNLILRGGAPVRIHASGHDSDQFADEAHDSLAAFGIYSTLQGRLSGSKDTVLASSSLRLGVHGFYSVAVDNEGDTSVSDTVWVPVQSNIGRALIVSGTPFGDNLYFFQNIAPTSNFVFGRLMQRGFTPGQIDYLNPIGWQGLTNPYVNDHIVDETKVTLANFRKYLYDMKPDVESGVPLLLVLIGHGDNAQQNGRFHLTSGEALSPDSLGRWLDDFKMDPSLNTPIIVVLDFCYAGSFFPRLLSPSQNRILIASSASDRQAYFRGGRSFSQAFFSAVNRGKSVADAFASAKDWSDANGPSEAARAMPWLSGNADVRYNEEAGDFAPLRQVYIGGSQQFQSAKADWSKLSLERLGPTSFKVLAQSTGSVSPDSAWCAALVYRGDSTHADSLPWSGGLMKEDSAGRYSAMLELRQVPKGEILVSVFGQVGAEPMMPYSAVLSIPDSTSGIFRRLQAGSFDLSPGAPNPFTTFTRIPYSLAVAGMVELSVFDMGGRKVKSLVRGRRTAGFHQVTWEGSGDGGAQVSAGIYWMQLKSQDGVRRRMIVRK